MALQTLEGHSDLVLLVIFLLNGKLIMLSSCNRTVRLWDVIIGTALQTLEGHSDLVLSVAFLPDGKLIVSGSDNGTVKL
jgi:WD40 repeat protein